MRYPPLREANPTGYNRRLVRAIMKKNLELFKRAIEQRQNNQSELLNENVHGLAERIRLIGDKCERSSNQILKLTAHATTTLHGISNFKAKNNFLWIQ